MPMKESQLMVNEEDASTEPEARDSREARQRRIHK